MGLASFLRDKTKAASDSIKQRDWTREQQALSSIKTWGTGYVSNLACKVVFLPLRAFSPAPCSPACEKGDVSP